MNIIRPFKCYNQLYSDDYTLLRTGDVRLWLGNQQFSCACWEAYKVRVVQGTQGQRWVCGRNRGSSVTQTQHSSLLHAVCSANYYGADQREDQGGYLHVKFKHKLDTNDTHSAKKNLYAEIELISA